MESRSSNVSPRADRASARFRVADWTVDPDSCCLLRNRETVKLEPKVMELLIFLSTRPNEVVRREVLESNVWAGTLVGYDTVTGAIQKLRRAFNDNPRQPRFIETLSKRGYRLVAPVTLAGDSNSTSPDGEEDGHPEPTPRSPLKRTVFALLLALLAAGLSALLWVGFGMEPGREEYHPKSIAVLPLDNLSDDSDQDYLADGITDDLITQLAKLSDLVVIARDSTFVYKGQPMDVRDIAARLGVGHLLHGSVRRSGEKLRINAQLIDASHGNHVWAESYELEVPEIFDVQDRITHAIVAALAARMNAQEREELARPRTKSAYAYDNFLQGRQRFFRYANREENLRARELFAKAVEYDPGFAMAYAMLAWTYAFDAMNGWSLERERTLLHARELAATALSLDEALPLAYFVIGLSYREKGEYVKALVEAEKAIRYDPNYANAHVLLATLLYYAGRPEEGLERIKKAILLNPHHPYNYTFHLGQAYYILHRYDEAIETLRQGLASNPASERLRVWLAAAYALAGEADEAEWQTEQILSLNPDFSVERMREAFPFKDPTDREHLESGLLKAGLPR